MDRVLFKAARLIDPASRTDETADVLVFDGLVQDVGKKLTSGETEIIDCDGAVIAPGFVDPHVHLREPGREDEERKSVV